MEFFLEKTSKNYPQQKFKIFIVFAFQHWDEAKQSENLVLCFYEQAEFVEERKYS
jgi:hypothetical protein